MEEACSFKKAFLSGNLCLHPTDSLPGITFDLGSTLAQRHFLALKGPRVGKGFVYLVSHVSKAFSFWQPLPPMWQSALAGLWPCALSVIFPANQTLNPRFSHSDGTICLRVPNLPQEAFWFQKVLAEFREPLPSTSVNVEGGRACTHWQEAARFVKKLEGGYVPSQGGDCTQRTPSTVIKILFDGNFEVVRQGLISREDILRQLGDV